MLDDQTVNKHYDLAGRDDVRVLIDELVSLLVHDQIPGAAVVFVATEPSV